MNISGEPTTRWSEWAANQLGRTWFPWHQHLEPWV